MARGFNLTLKLTKNIPTGRQQIRIVRRQQKAALTPVKDMHVTRRKEVVSDWSTKNRPGFSGTVGLKDGVQLIIKATGTEFKRLLWRWIDKTGTKAHRIPKSGKTFLSFIWGGPGSYKARTLPNPPRFGGLGKVVGGIRRVFRFVNHPGFAPRKLGAKINKALVKPELKAYKTGGVRGLRIAKGKGKVK